MKTINNIAHYIIGLSILHTIGNLTDWNDFDNYSKIVGVPLISLVIGGGIGFMIEWIESVATKSQFDLTDILRTSIGALFGGLIAMLFANLNLFMNITLGISAMLCLVELYFLYKIYKQRK